MIGYVPEKRHMWALAAAIGPLVLMIFLAVLAIVHRNEAAYPTTDAGLYAFHSDQCERPVDNGRFAEVQNTLSNVAYALAGTLILLRAQSVAGIILGANILILSVMSAFYHATLKDTPQVLDVVWVYAAMFSLSAYIASVHVDGKSPLVPKRWAWITAAVLWVALVVVVPLLFGLKAFWPLLGLTVFWVGAMMLFWVVAALGDDDFAWLSNGLVVLLGIVSIVLGFFIKLQFKWDSDAVFPILVTILIIQIILVFGLRAPVWSMVGWEVLPLALAFAIGAFYRLADGYKSGGEPEVVTKKLLCHPDSIFQAHAHWHLLSAVALLLGYDLVAQFRSDATGPGRDHTVVFPDRAGYDPASRA